MTKICIELTKDNFFNDFFLEIIKFISQKKNLTVDLIVVSSINSSHGASFLSTFKRNFLLIYLRNRRFINYFKELPVNIGYRSKSISDILFLPYDICQAISFFQKNKSSEDYSKINYREIIVGDLIIDSYLRVKPSPVFSANNLLIFEIILQVIRDYRKAYRYFNKFKPKLFLTTYTTYIEHGIPVRVALFLKINVVSFGNLVEPYKLLKFEEPFHTPDCSNYKSIFKSLNNKELKLIEAREKFKMRFEGNIDTSQSYMRISPYVSKNQDYFPNLNGKVIIFLHDFFDSPHVFSGMLFLEFWEWICLTIEFLMLNNICFYVKPHPNQIDLSCKVLALLSKKYKKIKIINYNNNLIFKQNIRYGVTMYGSVAHELAYFGHITIACANNIHSAYSFCKIAKTKEEYKYLLLNTFPHKKPEELRSESLEFYYMHNLYFDKEWLKEYLDLYREVWKTYNIINTDWSVKINKMKSFTNSIGFEKMVTDLMNISSF